MTSHHLNENYESKSIHSLNQETHSIEEEKNQIVDSEDDETSWEFKDAHAQTSKQWDEDDEEAYKQILIQMMNDPKISKWALISSILLPPAAFKKKWKRGDKKIENWDPNLALELIKN